MTERADHWAVWVTLLACVAAFVVGLWAMPGPSDAEAALDAAADLQDAVAMARVEAGR